MVTYIKLLGGPPIWPPGTRDAFLEKFSIFFEKTMWHFMSWKPIGSLSSSSKILNATFTALISFCIALHHRTFPISLSKIKVSSTAFGTLVPNLCVILWYLSLTAAMILCLFFHDMGCPPGECRFITYTHCLCIFSNFNRV